MLTAKEQTQPQAPAHPMNLEAARAFIEAHYLKNRTIVSADIPGILDALQELSGLELIRHRYRSGQEYGTWVIPPEWNIRQAWLKDAQGRVLASYDEHPLFVAPYAKPGRYSVSRDELLAHTYTQPREPEAYAYNWRYAFDARLRLKDWGISLPHRLAQSLAPGSYEVFIDAEVKDGVMLIGEIFLPGERQDTITLLSNFCHPGQVNDSFSGIVVFAEVMRALAQRRNRQYSYQLLVMPETIGSAAYLNSQTQRADQIRGAVFGEGLAWGETWYLKSTRRANTYMDLLAEDCRRRFPGLERAEFFDIIGNDELMFDAIQSGIPSLSLQKCPYVGYHTSNDTPQRIQEDDLRRAYDIVLHLMDVLERDAVYAFVHRAPFWMTRYDLFADDEWDTARFLRNRDVVYNLMDGKRSLLEIAATLKVSFEEIADYAQRMLKHGLIQLRPEALGKAWNER